MDNHLSTIPHTNPTFAWKNLTAKCCSIIPIACKLCTATPAPRSSGSCDGQRTVEEIIALLCAAYEQDEAVIAADVTATLDLFCNTAPLSM